MAMTTIFQHLIDKKGLLPAIKTIDLNIGSRCKKHNNLHKKGAIIERQVNKKFIGYIDIALEVASRSPYSHQHGAVLVSRGRIIAEGFNHPCRRTCGATPFGTHAEMDCMADFWKQVRRRELTIRDLNSAYLIVVRRSHTGGIQYSAPCHSCQKKFLKLHREYGMSVLYYT